MRNIRRFTLLLLATGCATAHEPDVGRDLERLEGRAFLVRRVTVPEVRGDHGVGLDLDGMETFDVRLDGRCDETIPDFASELGVPGGVDNALSIYVPALGPDLDGAFSDAIAGGAIRWAIRVAEVQAEGGRLELYVVDEVPALDAAGLLLEGQRLRAHSAGTIEATASANVAWGYFTARPDLAVDGGGVHVLPFDDFTLQGIALAAEPDALRVRGHLGGSFSVEALVESASRVLDFSPELVRDAVENTADLTPDARGACGRVSAGFAFEAVAVDLVL